MIDFKPRDYQVEGARWLAGNPFGYLADDMGLGKTAQAIMALDLLMAQNVLIVCPSTARIGWVREFKKVSKRHWDIAVRQKGEGANAKSQVVTFEWLTRNNSLFQKDWDAVIIDEAQGLKEPTSKRAKAILGACGVAHRTDCCWLLSGTPAPNHAGELWTWLYAFNRTKLVYDDFVERYCNSYEFKPGVRKITGTKLKHIEELKALIATTTLRRTKEQVLKDLPKTSFNDVFVEKGEVPNDPILKEKLRSEYERLQYNLDFYKPATDFELLRVLEVMAQSIATLRRITGLQKVQSICDLIKSELRDHAYEKIVIFAVHRDVITTLEKELKEFNPVLIHGGVTGKKRQQAIDSFQKQKEVRVFIGNIKAAGTAITLTASNQILFAELEWVPGHNNQASMRCSRIGQQKPVFVRFATLPDSVDEKITGVLRRKAFELSHLY